MDDEAKGHREGHRMVSRKAFAAKTCERRNVPAGTFDLFCTSIHLHAQHFLIELKNEAKYSAGALLLLTIQWDV
jgi:hypothetical protein